MKVRGTKWIILCAMLALYIVEKQASAQQYTVLPLGISGDSLFINRLNNSGQVVGTFGSRAVLTRPNAAFNPATDYLYGTSATSRGMGVNDLGQAVGLINVPTGMTTRTHATRSAPNAPFDLNQVDFGIGTSAISVNDSGQATGVGADLYAYRSNPTGSGISSIGGLGGIAGGGGANSQGNAINATGVIAGWSYTPSHDIHAFRAAGSSILPADDLGTLGGANSFGYDLNNAGVVVGESSISAFVSHAYRSLPGQPLQDLGILAGQNPVTVSSVANGINEAGWIVGRSGSKAFLWHDGQMIDLNSLAYSFPTSFLTSALDINDNGQILASASGALYLLTPVPEPASIAIFATGTVILLAIARRRKQ